MEGGPDVVLRITESTIVMACAVHIFDGHVCISHDGFPPPVAAKAFRLKPIRRTPFSDSPVYLAGRFVCFHHSALHRPIMLKKTDGLAWGIERACGSAQKPRETISPLRNYVATASYGTEGGNGLTACQPTQTFNVCGII